LLYTYAANAKKKHNWAVKRFLESCFGGWIFHVWGLWRLGGLAPCPHCPCPWCRTDL